MVGIDQNGYITPTCWGGMVGNDQDGYISPAFLGSPWWGEINLEKMRISNMARCPNNYTAHIALSPPPNGLELFSCPWLVECGVAFPPETLNQRFPVFALSRAMGSLQTRKRHPQKRQGVSPQ